MKTINQADTFKEGRPVGDNPYPMESPEWQLFALIRSMELNIMTMTGNVNKQLAMLEKERAKVGEYRTALSKLDPSNGAIEVS